MKTPGFGRAFFCLVAPGHARRILLLRCLSLGLALAFGSVVHGLLHAVGAVQWLIDGLGQRLRLRRLLGLGGAGRWQPASSATDRQAGISRRMVVLRGG